MTRAEKRKRLINATAEDFRRWREQLNFSEQDAARSLGRGRGSSAESKPHREGRGPGFRMIQMYETGAAPIPRVVRLAMIALEEHPELGTEI